MPCSVSVYEKSDGMTYVYSMNMKIMSTLFGSSIGDVLGQVADDDKIILNFLHE
jgi:hypothetical protein